MKRIQKLNLTMILSLGALLSTSCGTTDGETVAFDDFFGTSFGLSEDANIEDSMVDDELATEEIGEHVESAIEGLAAELEMAGTNMLSLGGESQGRFKRYRKCEEANDTAIVTIAHGLSFNAERDLPRFTINHTVKAHGRKVRTWSKDGEVVNCQENGKYADINLDNLAGMHLNVDIKRKRSRLDTLTHKNSDLKITRGRRAKLEGTRSVNFLSVVDSGDNKIVSKNMTMKMNIKAEAKNKKGNYRLLNRTLEIKDDKPFDVEVERVAADHALVSRLIKSGQLIATGKKGGKLEADFINVKFEPATGCIPVSGSIAGAFYKPDSDVASRTFVITFNGSDSEIEFGDGSKKDYAPSGCWLDRPAKPTDVGVETDTEADL